jgi:two-component SAPR family response regulator
MTILHVDEDGIYAKYLERALRASCPTTVQGLSYYHEHSPDGALAILDTHKVDLVICELDLYGHNGVEFLQELRSHADLLDIVIILLTSVPSEKIPSSTVMRVAWGIQEHFYKPTFSYEQFWLSSSVQSLVSSQTTSSTRSV